VEYDGAIILVQLIKFRGFFNMSIMMMSLIKDKHGQYKALPENLPDCQYE
jgi:hypothetical protein